MPKATIRVGDFSQVDAAGGFTNYDGPVPPRGLYRVAVKFWKLIHNGSGDPMFKLLMEIAEPEGSVKARFNGYAIWHNANITEKGAPFLNGMLDAFGIPRKAVYASAILLADDGERVVSIGKNNKIKVDGLEVLVNTKREEYPAGSGEFSLKVVNFAEASESYGRVSEAADDYEYQGFKEGDPEGDSAPDADVADAADDDAF